MFVQTQITPNPNSLKFLPGKKVSNSGSYEITKKDEIKNDLVRNILSINGVTGVFLGKDFISVNKLEKINWDEIKHIVITLINEHYQSGKTYVIDENVNEINSKNSLREVEKQIIKISDRNKIGCDQVIFIDKAKSSNAFLKFYNSYGKKRHFYKRKG